MKRICCFVIPLLLLVNLHASAQTLRIGSLNIENLGNRHPSTHEPVDGPRDPEDLANYIDESGIGVLALQEIHDTDGVDDTRTNDVLTETFDLLNERNGHNWAHQLLPKKFASSTSQLLAIAWNQEVAELVGQPLQVAVPDHVPHPDAPTASGFNVWDRGLHAIKFQATGRATDFVLIPVHLKSNVGGAAVNSIQRGIEAEILVDDLPDIREVFGDLDIVIAGDTNILSDDEPAIANLTASGFQDLNEDQSTFVTGAEFDRILVPGDRPAFAASAMTVFPSGFSGGDDGEHEQRISDHFAVFTDIAVSDEDDPGEEEMPAGEPAVAALDILAVLVDPVGRDTEGESVTIANGTADDVTVDGWKCVDRAGNEFLLTGVIPANSTRSFALSAEFALNNNGDEVRLIEPNGGVVDEVEYDADQVERGKFITFSP